MKFTLLFILSLIGFTSMSQNLPTGFETVAYEGFDYTSGTSLLGLNGGAGFSAAWTGSYQNRYMKAHGTGYTYSGLNTTGGRASYSSTCYGTCNDIASSDRTIPMQSGGIVYVQFLANLGPQAGGGTPQIRFRNTETNSWALLAGAVTNNIYKWGIWDTANTYMTTVSSNAERFVIIRFDYVNNNTKMWIDQDVTTFDYSNPTNPDATSPVANSFNSIDLYFRYNAPNGIDEIHVFKESSETFTNSSGDGQWDTASNWTSANVPTSGDNITISSSQTIEVGSDDAGTVSGTANENQTLTFTAPNGSTFTSVDFASYGTPTSSGGDFVIGSCHATNSQSIVESYLIGNTGSISIQASNGVFGDPCSGVVKRLYVKATYGSENSTTAIASSITIDSGGSLTIAANSDLTLSGDFTNNGTVTLNSDADEFASIIVGGSSSGDIVYNRYVNTVGSGEWDLIGAPTDGLSISSFVTTNSTPLATSEAIYAVGTYDNSNDTWTNYTTSSVSTAGNFDIGRGYQMATSSGATMAFTGTVATTDQTQSIINNAGNGGRRWNLVANPYPSYLNANTNAHASNNFLSVNSGVIDSTYSAIYGYNADGSGYSIYNNTTAATYIAPGQAFFVAAASSSAANLSFTEAMQTTTGGDDFIAGRLANTSSELYLKLYEGENLVGDTKFYFDNNLSLGLDPGYDAGAYNQSSALASRLAEDDQGVNMGINAMGIDSFEQTTIPLVVNTQAGTSFRISLEDLTIPESVEVFLEDTETQTFTNLRTEDFTLNPQSDLSGMGRFYLRLGNTSLGGSDVEESYISIYNPMDKDCITIEGLASIQKANVRLYNIIGQEILSKTLQTGQSTQNISTLGITTGIYVIKLQVDSTLISKKIVIN